MQKFRISRKVLLLSLLPALLCHTACSASPQPSSSPASSAAVAGAPDEAASSEYRFLSSPIAQTDSGFYDLVYTKDVVSGAQNIVYTDFSARHRGYLSDGDPQSETDASYIPVAFSGSQVLTDGDFLYVLCTGSLILQDSEGAAAQPRIYRMDLNGGHRTTVELPLGQQINRSSGVFSDGNSIVLMMDAEGADKAVHSELVRVDFSAKSITTLMDFSASDLDSANLFLVSAFGNHFVLSSTKFIGDGKVQNSAYVFDSAQGTLAPIAELAEDDNEVFYQHGNIYTIKTSQNALYQFHPADGQSELLIPELAPSGSESSMQISYSAPYPYLAFSSGDSEDSATYYWNCNTHEWKTSSLFDRYAPVHIQGIWQDYFLVNLQDKTVSYEDSLEGQSFTNQMTVSQYALISQEDYWNSTPNYIFFTDAVYGD